MVFVEFGLGHASGTSSDVQVGEVGATEGAGGDEGDGERDAAHFLAVGVKADDAPAVPHSGPDAAFGVNREAIGIEGFFSEGNKRAAIAHLAALDIECIGVDGFAGRIGEVENFEIRAPA